jgi:hypothetical protein
MLVKPLKMKEIVMNGHCALQEMSASEIDKIAAGWNSVFVRTKIGGHFYSGWFYDVASVSRNYITYNDDGGEEYFADVFGTGIGTNASYTSGSLSNGNVIYLYNGGSRL